MLLLLIWPLSIEGPCYEPENVNGTTDRTLLRHSYALQSSATARSDSQEATGDQIATTRGKIKVRLIVWKDIKNTHMFASQWLSFYITSVKAHAFHVNCVSNETKEINAPETLHRHGLRGADTNKQDLIFTVMISMISR